MVSFVLSVRLPADMLEVIRAQAEAEDRAINWIIRDLVARGLKAKAQEKAEADA